MSYVDEDFVLTSKTKPFRYKCTLDAMFKSCEPNRYSLRQGQLTSSQMTSTTKNLTYNKMKSYSPSRYSTTSCGLRTTSPTFNSAMRRSMSPSELKQSLRDTIAESRSRSRERFRSFNNRLQRSRSVSPINPRRKGRSPSPVRIVSPYNSTYSSLSQELDDAEFKEKVYRDSSKLATWATHPSHLSEKAKVSELRNSVRLSRHRSRSRSAGRSRSPSAEIRSFVQTSPARTSSHLYEDDYPLTTQESYAKEYFPVTMSAYKIEHIEPPMSRSMTTSPPPKHLRPKPEPKWRVDGKISITQPLDFSGRHADDSIAKISRMYNMAEVAPSIAASTVYMVSPYASELASLRLDRLKIEEDHLLEMKRLAEIERLRGPQPKWYELKTPQFHIEAQKNTQLVKNGEHWKELVDYRE